MEENNFFKLIWRFNGLLFAIAGILGIFVMSFAGYHMIQDIFRDRKVQNVVNVAENTEKEENWTLGHIEKIPGTQSVLVPLHSDQSYAQSYYSKTSYSVRNYLFANIKTNEKFWLFQTNKYLIANKFILSEQKYTEPERETRAILYKLIKKDTNGDKRLTDKDKITIAMSKASGKNYIEILKDIDVFNGYSLLDKNTMLLMYQINNIGYSANVSLSNFTLFNESKLPTIKGDS